MESAENQTELFEALLKWMASFRVAAGKMIREGFIKMIISTLMTDSRMLTTRASMLQMKNTETTTISMVAKLISFFWEWVS